MPKTTDVKNRERSVGDVRMILVDGMPGTGKSTLSQFIDRQLRAAGRSTVWHHEESAAHPVRLYYEPERHRSWAAYCDAVTSCWQRFAGELANGDYIAILDAGLFQNHVRSMLIFDCDRELIVDLMLRIGKIIAVCNPALIYLKPQDVDVNFRDVVENRGDRLLELWIRAHDQYPFARTTAGGQSGMIAFWQEFDELCDRAFDALSIKKLRQDVAYGDWGLRYAEVLELLNIPQPREESVADREERFVGEYRSTSDSPATGFRLQAQGDCLEATVDRPTFDIPSGPLACFRKARLIPQARNRYDVAGWPHEVEFEENAAGAIEKLTVSNTTEGWPSMRLSYKKLP